jgi:Ni/Co efflux regulator RcnB
MKHKILVTALAVITLANSGFVLAQGRDGRDGRDDRGGPNQRQGMEQSRGGPQYGGGPGRQQQQRPGHAEDRGRGAGPDHNFYRGGRLPPQYRGHQGVVNDWRNHRLSAPPRGYHWVQTGADYVLVAIATGIIAQIILGQ